MSQYKIAFIAPLTGDQMVVGQPMFDMTKFILDRLKGDLDIEMVGFDDMAEFDKAEEAAKAVAADPSILAVMQKNSDCLLAGAPYYEGAGLPFCTGSGTNFELGQKGFKGFRRFCGHDMVQARIPVKFAMEDLGMTRFVALHDKTTYGEPLAEEFANYVKKQGGTITDFIEIPVGTKDYTAIVNQIKNSGADAVFMALTEIEGSLTATALYESGVDIVKFAPDANPSKFTEMSVPGAMENAYITYAGTAITEGSQPYEVLKDFINDYPEIPVFSAELYDILQLLIKAIQLQENPSREGMVDALSKVEAFEGLTGEVSFNGFGEKKSAAITLWKIKGNGMDLVGSYIGSDVDFE